MMGMLPRIVTYFIGHGQQLARAREEAKYKANLEFYANSIAPPIVSRQVARAVLRKGVSHPLWSPAFGEKLQETKIDSGSTSGDIITETQPCEAFAKASKKRSPIALNLDAANRLREIARDRNGAYAGHAPKTTQRLRELGLIVIRGEKIAATGRRMSWGTAHVTEAGRRWLAENA